jgi:phage gp45-like
MLVRDLAAKLRNLFYVSKLQKRYDDGKVQVKTHNGKVLEKHESFPYGFYAKAKNGKAIVFCQGGNYNDFEILPLAADENTVLPKLEENDVAVYSDNNGNIKIAANGTGKVFIGNDSKNMCDLLTGLIDEIKNLVTFGSPTSQSIDPASKVKLEAYKIQIKQLLMESI